MDEGTLGRRGPRTFPAWMPWALGALAVGALVQVGARLAPDWYSIFGPYLLVDADMIIGTIRAVSPFALAAAVLVGARRWEAGRRWLHLGALAVGLQGVLGLGSDIWWAFWQAGPGEISDGVQLVLMLRFVASAIAVIAGAALLAVGLWSARAEAGPATFRRAVMVVIGLVGLVAVASGIWVVTRYFGVSGLGGPSEPALIAAGLLVGIGFAATALLAIAAVRAMPPQGVIPELLVALGATLVTGVTAWEWAFPYVVPLQDVPFDVSSWAFTLVSAMVTLGFVAMVAGFGAGALARRADADAPDG